jgi:hypothetical protein
MPKFSGPEYELASARILKGRKKTMLPRIDEKDLYQDSSNDERCETGDGSSHEELCKPTSGELPAFCESDLNKEEFHAEWNEKAANEQMDRYRNAHSADFFDGPPEDRQRPAKEKLRNIKASMRYQKEQLLFVLDGVSRELSEYRAQKRRNSSFYEENSWSIEVGYAQDSVLNRIHELEEKEERIERILSLIDGVVANIDKIA